MYKEIVKEILVEYRSTRDDDQALYAIVLDRLNFSVKEKSAFDLITKVRSKELPSLDTITRLRRMIQMQNASLRGNDWDVRHGIKVEKALTDLGYVVV